MVHIMEAKFHTKPALSELKSGEKSNAFVFAAAPNAPQFDAEKAKVVERNLILLHNSSLKEICFLTLRKFG